MNNYVILLRPSNFLITVASVFVSCILAGGGSADVPAMIMASCAAGLIGAGGMVVNDIFDIEIDRINKPTRPLPSSAVSPASAALFYAALTSVGLLLNLFLHSNAEIIAVAAVMFIFLYSYRLKKTPLLGNLTVGILTGLAFIYGGSAVGNINRAIMPAVFAFLMNVGREVIKDMEDVVGDRRHNAATFPIKFGMKPAAGMASLFLLAVIGATFIPFANHQYGITYFIVVTLGVNLVLLFVLYSLWNDTSSKNLNLLSTILKYDMFIGLVAIYLG